MITLILITLILLAFIELYNRSQPSYNAAKNMYGDRVYPIFGNTLKVIPLVLFFSPEQTFQYTIDCAQRYKKGYRFYAFGILHYWPLRAKEIEFLFNSTRFTDKSFMYGFLHPLLGDGLLTSNSKKWAQRRKILTPAFHFNILQKFLPIFKEETTVFINNLKNAKNKTETSLNEIVAQFTLNNICETAMGVKLRKISGANEYRHNIIESGELLVKRYVNPMLYEDFLYKMTSMYRDLLKSTAIVHRFTRSIIKEKRKLFANNYIVSKESTGNVYEKSRYAMLDTLLEAEANCGLINDEGIREEVDTFMFEGFDTTSTGIIYILFMLAHHQDMQQTIYEEIVELFGSKKDIDLNIHDYGKLAYLDRFIKETFRLYPPVPYIARHLNEDYHGDNIFLPKGSQAHVFLFNIHRDPEQYHDPEKFDPDRFLPENCEKRHVYAYMPFSAGPRNCIGQKFAMLEIKTLITKIMLECKLLPITKVEEIVFVSDLVLRTKEPIKVKFIERN